MKEIILENKKFRVIKEEDNFIDTDGSIECYFQYKLQKKGIIFWKTIVSHNPYLAGSDDDKIFRVYKNLFNVLTSAINLI